MKIDICLGLSVGQSALEKYFKSFLAKDRIIYVPNFGNAGDALIGLGAICFFHKLGMNWTIRRDWWRLKNQTVVFAGGGALVGHYVRSERAFSTLLQNNNKVVVLPHTITRLNPDALKWAHNLTVFCREHKTFEYVSQFKDLNHVGMDHDMAFHLLGNLKDILGETFSGCLAKALCDGSIKDRLRVVKRFPRAFKTRRELMNWAGEDRAGTINCFRQDVESSGLEIPERNHDISDDYAMGTETVNSIRLSAFALMDTLKRFSLVRTDRLHCCIGATLLGLPVEFYGNSYHKNQSVFEYSLRSHFENVAWRG